MREMRNMYKILFGKPEGKRQFGRCRRRWEIILEWILKKQVERAWTGCIWLSGGTSCGPNSVMYLLVP